MTDALKERYTAAALNFAEVALSPNGVRSSVLTDQYRTAFGDLSFARDALTLAERKQAPAQPVAPSQPTAVADGPGLSDRELEMHLKHFATADFAGGLVARELWERVKMLVKVDYEPGGSGKIAARIGATPDGATRITRVFDK